MSRVSYQGVLGTEPAAGAVYVRLGETAIATRRKEARKAVSLELSKAQSRWLRDAVEMSGPDIDEGAILRALVDLGTELQIDWAVIARGKALRAAVRSAVMVRRGSAA